MQDPGAASANIESVQDPDIATSNEYIELVGWDYVEIHPAAIFSAMANKVSAQMNQGARTVYGAITARHNLGREAQEFTKTGVTQIYKMLSENANYNPIETPGDIVTKTTHQATTNYLFVTMGTLNGGQQEDCVTISSALTENSEEKDASSEKGKSKIINHTNKLSFIEEQLVVTSFPVKKSNEMNNDPYKIYTSGGLHQEVDTWLKSHPHIQQLELPEGYATMRYVYVPKLGTQVNKHMILIPKFSVTDRRVGASSELSHHYMKGHVSGIRLYFKKVIEKRSDVTRGMDKEVEIRELAHIQVIVREYRAAHEGLKITNEFAQKGVIGHTEDAMRMPVINGISTDVMFDSHAIPSRLTPGWLVNMALQCMVTNLMRPIYIAYGTPIRTMADTNMKHLTKQLGYTMVSMAKDGHGRPMGMMMQGISAVMMTMHDSVDKIQAHGYNPNDNDFNPETRASRKGRKGGFGHIVFGVQENSVIAVGSEELIRAIVGGATSNIYKVALCKSCNNVAYVYISNAMIEVRCETCKNSAEFETTGRDMYRSKSLKNSRRFASMRVRYTIITLDRYLQALGMKVRYNWTNTIDHLMHDDLPDEI